MHDIVDKCNKRVAIGARKVKLHNAQVRANFSVGMYGIGTEAMHTLAEKLQCVPKQARYSTRVVLHACARVVSMCS